MKVIILSFVVAILVFSCRKPGLETEYVIERIIVNNSSHSIKIRNLVNYDIILQKNDAFDANFNYPDKPTPTHKYFIIETDSLEIIYDDTLTIFHGSNQYHVARDLRLIDNFKITGLTVDNVDYETQSYTFTNEDFMEADSIIE